MTEFKVGDKVRLTGHLWGVGTSPGQEGVVEITDVDGRPTFEGEDGTTWGIYAGGWDGELVEPARRTVDDIYEEEYGAKELGVDPVEEGDFVKTVEKFSDEVNHPPHYTAYKGIEVIQLTEQMNFNRGNAVKYIARAGLKNADTEIQDLKKAAWYVQREIERLEAK